MSIASALGTLGRRAGREGVRCRAGLLGADLLHQPDLVVEEVLFHDLAVFPSGHGAELELEGLVGGGDGLAVRAG